MAMEPFEFMPPEQFNKLGHAAKDKYLLELLHYVREILPPNDGPTGNRASANDPTNEAS